MDFINEIIALFRPFPGGFQMEHLKVFKEAIELIFEKIFS